MHADERRRGIRRDSSLDHQMHCGEVYLISPVFAEALIGGDRRASAVPFIFLPLQEIEWVNCDHFVR